MGNVHPLYDICSICDSKSHTVFSCPYIHLIPDKEKCVLRYNYSEPSKRKMYHRRMG